MIFTCVTFVTMAIALSKLQQLISIGGTFIRMNGARCVLILSLIWMRYQSHYVIFNSIIRMLLWQCFKYLRIHAWISGFISSYYGSVFDKNWRVFESKINNVISWCLWKFMKTHHCTVLCLYWKLMLQFQIWIKQNSS